MNILYLKSRSIIAVTLSVVLSFAFIALATNASTTISTNISTGGTLSVTGASTLTGLTSMIQASSTRLSVFDTAYFGGSATSTFNSAGVLTLTNGETISNATDGVIQLLGIASTTSLTLLNGETITNATDGTIALTGALTVSGVSSFTGLATLLGGATTTSLTLLNGEVISNGTDGVIQLGGVASTTSITLLNGETITNATDGTIALTGAVTVSGASTLTGLTSMIQASSTRMSVFDTAYFGGTATSSFTSAGVLTLTNGETISNATDGTITLGANIMKLVGTASTSALKVGDEANASTINGLVFGYCTVADISITASTSAYKDCTGATGVISGDRVFIQATSSLPARVYVQSASSTATTGTIQILLFNTGIDAGNVGASVGSFNFWAVRD